MSGSLPTKILGFNGLRGLSVILVFLAHKCGLGFHSAEIGVWAFFTISGFLIIGELHQQRIKIEGALSRIKTELLTFFIKRAIRIFPAYYALLVILFLLRGYFAHLGPDLGFRYHFLYLSDYWDAAVVPHGNGAAFGILWTLSVEQQFYVVAAFLFILAPSNRHWLICLIFPMAAALVHFGMYWGAVDANAIYTMSPWNFAIIAIGGLIRIRSPRPDFASSLSGLSRLLGLMTCLMVIAASGTLYTLGYVYEAMIDISLTLLIAGVVTWVRVNQASAVVRALEWRPLEYLGVISYGFYLIHNFIPNPLGRALSLYAGYTVPDFVKTSLGAAIGFSIAVAIAHVSWTYFERPILGLKGRLVRAVVASQGGLVTVAAKRSN